MPGQQQTLSPTWILFASGAHSAVELSLFEPPAERSRPMEAYIVSEAGAELARSASRAVEAVYAAAYAATIPPAPSVVGYDLPGLAHGCRISGASAGLALALALAKKLWPEYDPGPIAATGEIAAASNGAPLKRISDLATKAGTALKLLETGGSFFYPAANRDDLPPELARAMRERGIAIHPVSSVAEALGHFIPPLAKPSTPSATPPGQPARKHQRPVTLMLIGTLLLCGSLSLAIFRHTTGHWPGETRSSLPATTTTGKQPEKDLPVTRTEPAATTRPRTATVSPAKTDANPKNTAPVPAPAPRSDSNPAPRTVKQTGNHASSPGKDSPEQQNVSSGEASQNSHEKTASAGAQPQTATPSAPQPGQTEKTASSPAATPERKAESPAPTITLTAADPRLARLGKRARSRLAARLDAEPRLRQQIRSLRGQLEIVELHETRNPNDDSLSTTLILRLRGRIEPAGKPRQELTLPRLTLRFQGAFSDLPDNEATKLAEAIAKALHNRPATTPSLKPRTSVRKESPPSPPPHSRNPGFE